MYFCEFLSSLICREIFSQPLTMFRYCVCAIGSHSKDRNQFCWNSGCSRVVRNYNLCEKLIQIKSPRWTGTYKSELMKYLFFSNFSTFCNFIWQPPLVDNVNLYRRSFRQIKQKGAHYYSTVVSKQGGICKQLNSRSSTSVESEI